MRINVLLQSVRKGAVCDIHTAEKNENIDLLIPNKACTVDIDLVCVLEWQSVAIWTLSIIVNEPHILTHVHWALWYRTQDRLRLSDKIPNFGVVGEPDAWSEVQIEEACVYTVKL